MGIERQREIKNRTLEEARYLIDNHATVRQTAKNFGISKTTVYTDIVKRLPDISLKLYEEAKEILAKNKAESPSRGGLATQRKYHLFKKTI